MQGIIPFVSRTSVTEQMLWIDALRQALPEERFAPFADLDSAQIECADIAIVANPDPEQIRRLLNLVWVQSVWAGVERLVGELEDFQPEIVRLIDPELARTMAEAVLAWTLYLHRDMPLYAAQQRKRVWRQHDYVSPSERRVSLLGLGELGRAAAQMLKRAGFVVSGWSRTSKTIEGIETHSGEAGLRAMLSNTDILVCLLPLTNETRGLVNQHLFEHLPPKASIINFGRGPVVDTAALLKALDDGHLRHAVLDVFDVEPLPDDSPLWLHPQVTVLPHISAETNRTTASAIAAANIRTYRKTGMIPKGIDKQRGY